MKIKNRVQLKSNNGNRTLASHPALFYDRSSAIQSLLITAPNGLLIRLLSLFKGSKTTSLTPKVSETCASTNSATRAILFNYFILKLLKGLVKAVYQLPRCDKMLPNSAFSHLLIAPHDSIFKSLKVLQISKTAMSKLLRS